MKAWAATLKERFKEFGIDQTMVSQIPVCVVGRDDCLSLSITNNWIAWLLYTCDEICVEVIQEESMVLLKE